MKRYREGTPLEALEARQVGRPQFYSKEAIDTLRQQTYINDLSGNSALGVAALVPPMQLIETQILERTQRNSFVAPRTPKRSVLKRLKQAVAPRTVSSRVRRNASRQRAILEIHNPLCICFLFFS
jgi:hypothetical protein